MTRNNYISCCRSKTTTDTRRKMNHFTSLKKSWYKVALDWKSSRVLQYNHTTINLKFLLSIVSIFLNCRSDISQIVHIQLHSTSLFPYIQVYNLFIHKLSKAKLKNKIKGKKQTHFDQWSNTMSHLWPSNIYYPKYPWDPTLVLHYFSSFLLVPIFTKKKVKKKRERN